MQRNNRYEASEREREEQNADTRGPDYVNICGRHRTVRLCVCVPLSHGMEADVSAFGSWDCLKQSIMADAQTAVEQKNSQKLKVLI